MNKRTIKMLRARRSSVTVKRAARAGLAVGYRGAEGYGFPFDSNAVPLLLKAVKVRDTASRRMARRVWSALPSRLARRLEYPGDSSFCIQGRSSRTNLWTRHLRRIMFSVITSSRKVFRFHL